MKDKVSIVIPVYNGEKYVGKAIESALNQTYKNIEIVVVNDGSKDKTDQVIQKYLDKIIYIKKENGGVATALNVGITKSSGKYISWLSHDDLYKPNKIEKMMDIITNIENKQTIIFCNVEFINYRGKVIGKTDYINSIGEKLINNGIYPILKGATNGCAMLISKKCFDEVGLFDESMRTTNDYDMWIRLFKKYPSYFINDYLIQYRLHPGQDTNKHPEYIRECDELWSSIINNLQKKDFENWQEYPQNIYYDLYFQMQEAGFLKASKLAKELASKCSPIIETSILMPAFNTEKYIGEAIESIINQRYATFELIIIDDNSTDNTYSIATKYAKKDKRIKVVKNKYTKGVSGALNTGLEIAKGKYVTRQDSDDTSENVRIKKQVEFLNLNKKYIYCATDISLMTEKGQIYVTNVYDDTPDFLELSYCFGNSIPNATIMYDLGIIKKNKMKFNEEIVVSEDFDFLLKYCLLGRGHLIKEPLYNYRIINGLYNKNEEKAKEIGLKLSNNYCQKVTGEKVPNFLNDFSLKKAKNVSDKELDEFLKRISKLFSNKYQYLGDYSKYLTKKKNMSNGKNTNKGLNKKRISNIKKTIISIQTRGVKQTAKKIIQKIKR